MKIEDNGEKIRFLGRLDSNTFSKIENQLTKVLSAKCNLIIDLNDLETIDVSGIFMLFDFKETAKRKFKNVSIILDSSKTIDGM